MENANMPDEQKVSVRDITASPMAYGSALLGWLSIIFAGIGLKWYGVGAAVLPTLVVFGVGFLIVALTSWKKGNEFGLFAFGIIALFAWTFAGMFLFPAMHLSGPPSTNELATVVLSFAVIVWAFALITSFFPVRLLTIIIALAAILFTMVGFNFLSTSETLDAAIGWLSIIVGILALYMAIGEVINGCARKEMCPMLMKKPKKG